VLTISIRRWIGILSPARSRFGKKRRGGDQQPQARVGPKASRRISLKLVAGIGYGEGRLTVSDNGRRITQPNPTGSGLKLIAALARQIGGRVDQVSSDRGTTTSFMFPLMT
jgi:hypothetical protein